MRKVMNEKVLRFLKIYHFLQEFFLIRIEASQLVIIF